MKHRIAFFVGAGAAVAIAVAAGCGSDDDATPETEEAGADAPSNPPDAGRDAADAAKPTDARTSPRLTKTNSPPLNLWW